MTRPAKGYFARAYAGEEKPGPLYWWYGFWPAFGASAFLNLAFSVSPYEPGAGIMNLLVWKPLFVVPTVGAFGVTLVWLFRSVWRCAPNAATPGSDGPRGFPCFSAAPPGCRSFSPRPPGRLSSASCSPSAANPEAPGEVGLKPAVRIEPLQGRAERRQIREHPREAVG